MLKPEVGSRDSWSETEIHKEYNMYTRVRVRKEVELALEITRPMGNAIITHTGAYGRKKFVFKGDIWITESAPNNKLASPDRKCFALNVAQTRCIDIAMLSFNRTDWDAMHLQFIRESKGRYWLEVETVMESVQ